MADPQIAVQAASAQEREASLLDRIVEQQKEVASRYKPVMPIEEAIERKRIIDRFMRELLVENVDYGKIPGSPATAKPSLWKSGAEKACAFFGYVPRYVHVERIEEWTAAKYGEPLFYYRYTCDLEKDGHRVGSGEGSANTWESKYRYRKAERTCPSCGQSTIIRGKKEYGGGWLCFAKKGGCGEKFKDGDESIEAQETGRIANPDFADVINTVQKMGQKRAYIQATLTATGLSEYLTQDLEDMATPAEWQQNTPEQQAELAQKRIAEEQQKAAAAPKPAAAPAPAPASPAVADSEELAAIIAKTGTADGRRGALGLLGDLAEVACGEEFAYKIYNVLLTEQKVTLNTLIQDRPKCLLFMRAWFSRIQDFRQAAAEAAAATKNPNITDEDVPLFAGAKDTTYAE